MSLGPHDFTVMNIYQYKTTPKFMKQNSCCFLQVFYIPHLRYGPMTPCTQCSILAPTRGRQLWWRACNLVSSDVRDRIRRPIWSIPCLLMPWLLKSPGHQQSWHQQYRIGTCICAPFWIWSSFVEYNPRYDTKWECIFIFFLNNRAC